MVRHYTPETQRPLRVRIAVNAGFDAIRRPQMLARQHAFGLALDLERSRV
jgi:hypothetical protein